jgi:hypothetical protein
MLEMKGNLWTIPANARCVTTNGDCNRHGNAVMGRGCALEARKIFPGVDAALGRKLRERGNHVHRLMTDPDGWELVSFPVKHHWQEDADIQLIKQSCQELSVMAEMHDWLRVLLPRPGCGNGRLAWETLVKPIIEPLLSDRIVVISF